MGFHWVLLVVRIKLMRSLSRLTPCSLDYLVLYCPQQLIALLWLWRLIYGHLAFYHARCLEFQVRRLRLQRNYQYRIYKVLLIHLWAPWLLLKILIMSNQIMIFLILVVVFSWVTPNQPINLVIFRIQIILIKLQVPLVPPLFRQIIALVWDEIHSRYLHKMPPEVLTEFCRHMMVPRIWMYFSENLKIVLKILAGLKWGSESFT